MRCRSQRTAANGPTLPDRHPWPVLTETRTPQRDPAVWILILRPLSLALLGQLLLQLSWILMPWWQRLLSLMPLRHLLLLLLMMVCIVQLVGQPCLWLSLSQRCSKAGQGQAPVMSHPVMNHPPGRVAMPGTGSPAHSSR